MNILFVVPSYKPAYTYGGPIVVISLLAETLAKTGHTITVYTTTANGRTELDVPTAQAVLVDGVQVFYFPRITGDHTHISPALWRQLHKTVRTFDVVHLHSWWNALILGAAWVCQRHHIKPIISPHGMFSEYILQTNNSNKKKLLHTLLGKKLLRNTHLHVSTDMELTESRNIISSWPGSIIPNPVILTDQHYPRSQNSIFTLGFLSRIDPKKGLDVLIKALGQVDFPYKLRVAGDGDPLYVQSLKNLACTTGNADKIEWVGWKDGEDKFKFLASLDVFCLLSHSENFAIVVIESLAAGTPVLVSRNVGLHTFVSDTNYGWTTSMKSEEIIDQLNKISQSKKKIKSINQEAPQTIRHAYAKEQLAAQYVNLYQTAIS